MRAHWSSRIVFVLASVGSVVGLGNVWRFPYLAHEFGGAAFLIPYIILLLLVGVPLLSLELFIGQRAQKPVLESFKPFQGIGFLSLAVSFLVSSYYVIILAWLFTYSIASIWLERIVSTPAFFDSIATSPTIVVVCAIVWMIVYLMLSRGLGRVEKAMQWIVPLPIILLAILLARVVFAPGALEGISSLLVLDLSSIFAPKAWVAAAGQIFFSLSIGFGAMVVFGSFRKRKSNVFSDALAVSLLDTVVSIGCAAIVFATLGVLSNSTGSSIQEVVASGPQLVFDVFPQALALLPLAPLVAIVFFASLFLIGLSSQVSIAEAIVDELHTRSRKNRTGLFCFLGFFASLAFAIWPHMVEFVDYFAVNYGLVLVAILEVLFVILVANGSYAKLLKRYVKSDVVAFFWRVLQYVVGIVLTILLVLQIVEDVTKNMFSQTFALIGLLALIVCIVLALFWQFSRR